MHGPQMNKTKGAEANFLLFFSFSLNDDAEANWVAGRCVHVEADHGRIMDRSVDGDGEQIKSWDINVVGPS